MRRPAPLSYGSAAILHAVASGSRFGFDIMDATGLDERYGLSRAGPPRVGGLPAIHLGGRIGRARRGTSRAALLHAHGASGATALRAALAKYKALRPLPGFAPEQA